MFTLVCQKIDNPDLLFELVDVVIRMTSNGIEVTFPAGYGLAKLNSDEYVYNLCHTVIGEWTQEEPQVLRMYKKPILFADLREELKTAVRIANDQKENDDETPNKKLNIPTTLRMEGTVEIGSFIRNGQQHFMNIKLHSPLPRKH